VPHFENGAVQAVPADQDFGKDGSGPMTLGEKKERPVGRKWVYVFNRRNAKKLIPV